MIYGDMAISLVVARGYDDIATNRILVRDRCSSIHVNRRKIRSYVSILHDWRVGQNKNV